MNIRKCCICLSDHTNVAPLFPQLDTIRCVALCLVQIIPLCQQFSDESIGHTGNCKPPTTRANADLDHPPMSLFSLTQTPQSHLQETLSRHTRKSCMEIMSFQTGVNG